LNLKPMLPRKGPILEYIERLSDADQQELTYRLRQLLNDGDGAILMELLDKSVNERLYDLASDPRASEYAMAWRYLVSDLQLIARTENAYLSPMARGSSQARR
jgi:hypothetical protein